MADDTAPAAEEDRVFVRLVGQDYTGRKSFKLQPHVPFKKLKSMLGVECTLKYNNKDLPLDLAPQDMGMKLGLKNAVRIDVIISPPKEELNAVPEFTPPAAEARTVASSPPRKAPPLPPASRPPPKWAPAPGAGPTGQDSDEDRAPAAASPGSVFEAAPQSAHATPVRAPKETPGLVATPTPSSLRSMRTGSPSELRNALPPPPTLQRPTTAVQPAMRPAPAPSAQVSFASSAPVPASTLGGPGRVATLRQTKPHHELRTELQPGVPSHALDRHRREGSSPPRAAFSLGASRASAVEQPSAVPAMPSYDSHHSASAPQQQQHWSHFYTLRNEPSRPVAPSPPRESTGVVVAYHADPSSTYVASSRGLAPRVVDAVPHYHPDRGAPPSPPPPPPPPPVPVPQQPLIPIEEFFALKREVGKLRNEVESLQDALSDERAHREVLENQVRQLASVVLAQMEQQQAAAADDFANKEHHRQMQALREQRRASSSVPRTAD